MSYARVYQHVSASDREGRVGGMQPQACESGTDRQTDRHAETDRQRGRNTETETTHLPGATERTRTYVRNVIVFSSGTRLNILGTY